jgi:F-type H+-transporting ATPase subunit alpha
MDKATQNQLARGARMVELLKQGQYQPLPVERQILALYAGLNGFLDQLPIADIGRWERELYPWMESRRPDVLTTIRAKCNDGKAFNELTEIMKSSLTEYNKEFSAGGGGAAGTKAAAAPQA